MKQLGCFRRITQFRLPSDLLPDYANPNNDCDESRDDWPFDVRLSNEGNEASAKIGEGCSFLRLYDTMGDF